MRPWVNRLINAFGSPNNCNANEICAWHRDSASSFTTGAGIGTPDYERAGCILLWGFNPSTSWLAAASAVAGARARGARLVVVDPRRVGLAVKADQWLPVRPGTDGALALSIAGVMIAQGWYDAPFLRDWTNGPFLVRDDTGGLLRADELAAGGDGDCVVAWDEGRGAAVRYDPRTRRYDEAPARLALFGAVTVAGRDGPIACRPAFDLFAALCRDIPPDEAARVHRRRGRRHTGNGAPALASPAGGLFHLDRARTARQRDADGACAFDTPRADRQRRCARRQRAAWRRCR